MLNLKEKIKYCHILRRSINHNFEKAKHMENVSENYNFNELLAIKTGSGEQYSKIKTLNKDILNILLEQDGGNDKEIEIEEKTSDKFDLKYRANLLQIEGLMTSDSFSEIAENSSREKDSLFCKKLHKCQNCCIVSDIQTRKNIVRTSKHCSVPLKGSHLEN